MQCSLVSPSLAFWLVFHSPWYGQLPCWWQCPGDLIVVTAFLIWQRCWCDIDALHVHQQGNVFHCLCPANLLGLYPYVKPKLISTLRQAWKMIVSTCVDCFFFSTYRNLVNLTSGRDIDKATKVVCCEGLWLNAGSGHWGWEWVTWTELQGDWQLPQIHQKGKGLSEIQPESRSLDSYSIHTKSVSEIHSLQSWILLSHLNRFWINSKPIHELSNRAQGIKFNWFE